MRSFACVINNRSKAKDVPKDQGDGCRVYVAALHKVDGCVEQCFLYGILSVKVCELELRDGKVIVNLELELGTSYKDGRIDDGCYLGLAAIRPDEDGDCDSPADEHTLIMSDERP